jgi:hypothetical protein
MRRGILIGAAIFVAVAAAIPLWLVLDNGNGRSKAALVERAPDAVNCQGTRDPEACAEVNSLLRKLDAELAEIDARQASVDLIQEAITEKLANQDELSAATNLQLQRYMEAQSARFTMLSNIMKKYHDAAQAIINNLK